MIPEPVKPGVRLALQLLRDDRQALVDSLTIAGDLDTIDGCDRDLVACYDEAIAALERVIA